jgi:hypothetical protein
MVQKTYRLSKSSVEFVEALAAKGILGHTEPEVVRTLLERAINALVTEDYVRKYLETMKTLR